MTYILVRNIILGLSILACIYIIVYLIRDRDMIMYDKNIVGWNKENKSRLRKNSIETILCLIWIFIAIADLFS